MHKILALFIFVYVVVGLPNPPVGPGPVLGPQPSNPKGGPIPPPNSGNPPPPKGPIRPQPPKSSEEIDVDLPDYLGPANVRKIPSDVWKKIMNNLNNANKNPKNPLWFLSPLDLSKIPKDLLEKILFWFQHHENGNGKPTNKPGKPWTKPSNKPGNPWTKRPRTTTTESGVASTKTPVTVANCTQCAPALNVSVNSTTINQTRGTDPVSGCSTITFTCTNPNGGQVLYQYFNKGQDLGTSTANGTISRTVLCNAQGQYWFTENGIMRFIDTVDCIIV